MNMFKKKKKKESRLWTWKCGALQVLGSNPQVPTILVLGHSIQSYWPRLGNDGICPPD